MDIIGVNLKYKTFKILRLVITVKGYTFVICSRIKMAYENGIHNMSDITVI